MIDLQVILSTMKLTVRRLHDHCENLGKTLQLTKVESRIMFSILEEFNEYVMEAEMYAKRGKALKEKARSTAKLVCYNSRFPLVSH